MVKMVKMWHFFIFLELYCDQTVWFFSTVLKTICPGHAKNVFCFGPTSSWTWARAVWSYCHWRWWWRWFVSPLSPKLQTALAQVLDEQGDQNKNIFRKPQTKSFHISWEKLKKIKHFGHSRASKKIKKCHIWPFSLSWGNWPICKIQIEREKSGWGKKWVAKSAIKGGGRRLLSKSKKNDHFFSPFLLGNCKKGKHGLPRP